MRCVSSLPVISLVLISIGCSATSERSETPFRRPHGSWPNCFVDIHHGTLKPVSSSRTDAAVSRTKGEIAIKLYENSSVGPAISYVVVKRESLGDSVAVDVNPPGLVRLGIRDSGRYQIIVNSIGYQPTTATVIVRAGWFDQFVLPVEQVPVC